MTGRRGHTRITVLITLLLAASSGGTSVSAASDAVDVPDIADAIRFRSEFGLTADANEVHRSFIDDQAYPDMEWGLPLSRLEADELHRRLEVREAIVPAMRYAIAQAQYGGIFIDQKERGLPTFCSKGT